MEKIKKMKGFLWVRYAVFDNPNLNGSDIMVYATLMRFMNNNTQECYPSIKKIAELARLHKRTVLKSLDILETEKLIYRKRGRGRVNRYVILEPPEFKISSVENVNQCKKRTSSSAKREPAKVTKENHEQYLINKTKNNKDLSFNSEIKRDAEAQKIDKTTPPLIENSPYATRAANFEKSERPSLKDYTLSDLIELFEANPREPPASISRPQMLAAILDKIPGFEAITAKNNWKTIMVRLGQLFSDKRKEPLEYCDLIASVIKFKTIPKPKDKPANLDYLIAVLTYSAQELAEDRFEAEHYARKLSQGELREVNALIADMADDFRMKDNRIKDTYDLDQRRDSLKAALRRKLAEEENGRIAGNTS